MTTFTIYIDDKKTEKAIKAILEAFALDYNIKKDANPNKRPLNKAEQAMYKRLKGLSRRSNFTGKVKLNCVMLKKC